MALLFEFGGVVQYDMYRGPIRFIALFLIQFVPLFHTTLGEVPGD